jgi:hypothetical protein
VQDAQQRQVAGAPAVPKVEGSEAEQPGRSAGGTRKALRLDGSAVAASTRLLRGHRSPPTERCRAYRGYLLGLATMPSLGLFLSFRRLQKTYAVFGLLFVPLLALVLLKLNGRGDWVGPGQRNGWLARLTLVFALLFCLWCDLHELWLG